MTDEEVYHAINSRFKSYSEEDYMEVIKNLETEYIIKYINCIKNSGEENIIKYSDIFYMTRELKSRPDIPEEMKLEILLYETDSIYKWDD